MIATKKAAKKRTTKKVVPSPSPKPTVLERLLESVTLMYPQDPTTPGLTLAKLKTGEYYLSIKRYNDYGKNGYVVVSHKDRDLANGVKELARKWITYVEPLQNLKKEVEQPLGRGEIDDITKY